jgi:hypothetical protein
VPLPPTVQSIYAAQLDDLPASARDVARRGSVAGRRFPVAAFRALDVADGEAGTELLVHRALVSGPADDDLFGASFAYRHALLRDAGYASLTRADRVRLHVQLARWLEGRGDRAAELVGRHYARALADVPALAPEVAPGLGRDECRRLAAHWLERAAAASLELDAHESARELLGRALELTVADEPADRARRLASLGAVTASTLDMDEGARLLEDALAIARSAGDRDGIAQAAGELSRVLDQQVQFLPAARTADAALAEIGERDDLATGWLLLRRAIATANGSDAVDGPRTDAERALAIARAEHEPRLELESLGLIATLGRADLDALAELEELAAAHRAWPTAADAIRTRALVLTPDRAAEARPIARRAVELCEAHGLREDLAWSLYVNAEIGLVSGAWDAALAAGRRALELGVAGGFDRAVIRTWSTILPIAAARRDDALLGEGGTWLADRFREPERPSPYALVMMAARGLDLVAAGLREPFVPEVDERVASFGLAYASPSWLAALGVVLDAWLAAGELDGAARALERLGEAQTATLGRAEHALLTARLLAARGDDPSAAAERALTGFREAAAPWWIAQALRLLPGEAAAAEAAGIERALGLPG